MCFWFVCVFGVCGFLGLFVYFFVCLFVCLFVYMSFCVFVVCLYVVTLYRLIG